MIISLSYSAGKRQIKVHCLPLSSYISPSARTAPRFSLLHGWTRTANCQRYYRLRRNWNLSPELRMNLQPKQRAPAAAPTLNLQPKQRAPAAAPSRLIVCRIVVLVLVIISLSHSADRGNNRPRIDPPSSPGVGWHPLVSSLSTSYHSSLRISPIT